jgi:hypothetical protein
MCRNDSSAPPASGLNVIEASHCLCLDRPSGRDEGDQGTLAHGKLVAANDQSHSLDNIDDDRRDWTMTIRKIAKCR